MGGTATGGAAKGDGTGLPHVLIVGGGFGGLRCAENLRRASCKLTLVDRRNFHLFQPLLYQVATGALSPANVAAPLRSILRRQKNCSVLLGEVDSIDVAGKRVLIASMSIAYDYLVLATGASHHYFGHPEWERFAPGLKTVEDATEIRARIFAVFEAAEREPDEARRRALLTFVVVGGGPTGVELAGALGELAQHTLRKDFRRIDTAQSRILLVEGSDRVLPSYVAKLSDAARHSLARLGVTVVDKSHVVGIDATGVTIKHADSSEHVESHAVVWAAGVQGSPLAQYLVSGAGAEVDRAGRVMVTPRLTVPNHDEIFVIGDLAHVNDAAGAQLPGVAQVAMQQGKYVARSLEARWAGKSVEPFRYTNLGNMATIGRAAAVAEIGPFRFSGHLAWLAWLFVHLVHLVQFQNRVLVLVQWAWNYITRNRAARLITGEEAIACANLETGASNSATSPVGTSAAPHS